MVNLDERDLDKSKEFLRVIGLGGLLKMAILGKIPFINQYKIKYKNSILNKLPDEVFNWMAERMVAADDSFWNVKNRKAVRYNSLKEDVDAYLSKYPRFKPYETYITSIFKRGREQNGLPI